MKRIAIDMDEVIADTLKKHLELYNKDFGENVTPEHTAGLKLREFHPHRHEEIQAYFDNPDFLRNLDVMEGSQEVIQELSKSYEIFIATAAMEIPKSFTAKYDWLQEHFPFLNPMNYVFCGNKSIIHADYLIDDSVRHFSGFQGQGILFSAPHNVHETGYVRVDSWWDVRKFFLGDK